MRRFRTIGAVSVADFGWLDMLVAFLPFGYPGDMKSGLMGEGTPAHIGLASKGTQIG
jgi:hypothetical protein